MQGIIGISVVIAVFLIILILIVRNIKIVPQAHAYVIERLGTYHATWQTGLHLKVPFVDRISKKVSLKEQVVDFPPQPVITRDNVTMQIDTVVYFEITDPKLYTYGVERPLSAIENLTATTLRNIIGDLELDNTLTSRDTINDKNILPPREIQDAMEKQMKAERERRARILDAEGEKRSQILVAEGLKESAILKADAVKEQKIREAQGEAEAILTVQKANADALRMLNEAAPTDKIIQLKSLEAFAKAADGKATKIIIPSDIQGLAGSVAAIKEVWKDEN